MKNIVFLILLFLIYNITSGQSKYPKQLVGIGFNNISGIGIQYQLELSPQYVTRFAGFAYYTNENNQDNLNFYGNFGADLQYNIFKAENHRIYSMIGASFWYLQNKNTTEYLDNFRKVLKVDNDIKRLINTGIGLGYEYKVFPRLAIGLDLGILYQLRLNGEGNFDYFFDRVANEDAALSWSIGLGLKFQLY